MPTDFVNEMDVINMQSFSLILDLEHERERMQALKEYNIKQFLGNG